MLQYNTKRMRNRGNRGTRSLRHRRSRSSITRFSRGVHLESEFGGFGSSLDRLFNENETKILKEAKSQPISNNDHVDVAFYDDHVSINRVMGPGESYFEPEPNFVFSAKVDPFLSYDSLEQTYEQARRNDYELKTFERRKMSEHDIERAVNEGWLEPKDNGTFDWYDNSGNYLRRVTRAELKSGSY